MAKRQDYIVKIHSVGLIVIKGGQPLRMAMKPPERLRVDSAFSASSAVADAAERWLNNSARNWYTGELHEYTITADVWPHPLMSAVDRKSYKVVYTLGLNRIRKPTRIPQA